MFFVFFGVFSWFCFSGDVVKPWAVWDFLFWGFLRPGGGGKTILGLWGFLGFFMFFHVFWDLEGKS